MAITNTDIVNRALQLIGTRTNITVGELAANSTNEAIQANLAFTAIRDWCLGAANWNFARRTAKINILKQIAPPPTVPWSSTSVSPPWLYEYALPADTLKVQYLTNSAVNTGLTSFVGEPKRFVVAVDVVAAVEQRVILTNEASAVIIYTAQITDPTEWPWFFERFMVSALAWTLNATLDGDREFTKYLDEVMMRFFSIAVDANNTEGLSFNDTTPEWIQALGINYPLRRPMHKPDREPKGQPRGN